MPPSKRKSETTQGPWKRGERSKVSLMQVFRSSFHEKDAERAAAAATAEGTELSRRSRARRDGVGEEALRAHLQADLGSLLNTIRLDAVVDLDDVPHVRSSVLNYGFRDLSTVGLRELGSDEIIRSIRQSLLDHEPRIVPSTLEIRLVSSEADARQFLTFEISADLMGDPVDIPLDFTADVDLGAGKLRMSKLSVKT